MKLTITIADAIDRLTHLLDELPTYVNKRRTFARWIVGDTSQAVIELAMQSDGCAVVEVMQPSAGGFRGVNAATVILAKILEA